MMKLCQNKIHVKIKGEVMSKLLALSIYSKILNTFYIIFYYYFYINFVYKNVT